MGDRAAAILVRGQELLLMHRCKGGLEYYTLPGGGVEEGETPEAACVREVGEETGLTVVALIRIVTLENEGRLEHYFHVTEFSGVTALGGPEAQRNMEVNAYSLIWLSLSKLHQADLRPHAIKQVILSL